MMNLADGRRHRSIVVDGVELDLSWIWSFRRLVVSQGPKTLLAEKKLSQLRKGVELECDGGISLKIKLDDRAAFGPPMLAIHRMGSFSSHKVVDIHTSLFKNASFFVFLGIVYFFQGS